MLPETPMRRRILWLSGALLLVGLATWLGAWATTPTLAGNHGYDSIRLGMTQAEVEGVVGMPPGHYRKGLMHGTEWGDTVQEEGLSSETLSDPERCHSLAITLQSWI